jgi:hypothetical protein
LFKVDTTVTSAGIHLHHWNKCSATTVWVAKWQPCKMSGQGKSCMLLSNSCGQKTWNPWKSTDRLWLCMVQMWRLSTKYGNYSPILQVVRQVPCTSTEVALQQHQTQSSVKSMKWCMQTNKHCYSSFGWQRLQLCTGVIQLLQHEL